MAGERLTIAVSRVALRQRRRFRRLGERTLLGAAASAASLVLAPALGAAGLPLGLLAAIAALLMLTVGYYLWSNADADPTPHPSECVVIDADTVSLGDAPLDRLVARSDLEDGVLDDDGRVVLRLRDGSDAIIQTRDPADGPRLLAALGLGVEARVAAFSVGSFARTAGLDLPVGMLTGVFGLVTLVLAMGAVAMGAAALGFGHGEPTALGAALAAVLCLGSGTLARTLKRAASRRTVRVGTDGIRIQGATRTFVPLADVVNVVESSNGIVLTRKSGNALTLPTVPGSEGLSRRIREAMATHGRSAELPRLEKGDRSVEAWRADLAKLVQGSGDYREAQVTVDDLARVTEDAAQPAQVRVGAALAIAATDDAGAKDRVRFAAAATEDPATREALEEAADGEVAERTLSRVAG